MDYLEDYLKPGMKALDIGSGSGYITACIARLMGGKGKVYGIEIDLKEIQNCIKNLQKDEENKKLLQEGIIELINSDGKEGYVMESPYNAIHVGGYLDEYPYPLIDQLDDHGRLIVSILEGNKQKLKIFTKIKHKIIEKEIGEVEFTKII